MSPGSLQRVCVRGGNKADGEPQGNDVYQIIVKKVSKDVDAVKTELCR
jgi:hypothetical protein